LVFLGKKVILFGTCAGSSAKLQIKKSNRSVQKTNEFYLLTVQILSKMSAEEGQFDNILLAVAEKHRGGVPEVKQ